ncbi:hypothetical protein F511_19844 [Dorcoceras hygrometricum]|uniref:Uncharacterized protein n=1 Tax=Dorcoceras hygrometricum TaxID=472368 RepID=A0A2Z7BWM7_9LAMI|nr:hypothetical protein F511_19844 [Dorcoceras hygrometricum]
MVTMFKALESSGLRSFLGCSADIYEGDLEDFFETALVRENAVINCVQGKLIEISEEQFAGVFELPSEGQTSVEALPKDLIKVARKAFSESGEPKDFMQEKGDKGYGDSLFKASPGFAVQICVLLKGAPDLTLGESKAFPPLKILTVNIVGTYVAKNKSVSTTAEEVKDEPVLEKVVKTAAKRRPAPIAEPAAKKKRTTVGRAAPTENTLAIVPVVQEVVPISIVPVESPRAQSRQAPKRKLILQAESDEEESEEEIVVVET